MADLAAREPSLSSGGAAPATEETSEAPRLSPSKALVGIVIQPLDTLRALRDATHSYWWLVFAITAVTIVLFEVASASVQLRVFQAFSQNASRFAGATGAGGTARQFQQPSLVALAGLPLLGGLIVTLADYGLRALVTFGTSMILGGQTTFKQAFRMGVWTTIPYAVRRVVQAIAVITTGGQIAAGLSAAMTTAEARSLPIISNLLSNLDFYAVWSVLLLGVGTAVTARLGKGKSLVTVLVYVGLSLAGILIFFAISSAVSGLLGGTGSNSGRFPGAGGGAGGTRTPRPGG